MAYIYIYSGILSDILSGILSGIYSDILSGVLSGIYFDILSGIYSDILSGILSDILFWHSLCLGPGAAHSLRARDSWHSSGREREREVRRRWRTRMEDEDGGRGCVAPLSKSRDPHLAGWGKMTKRVHQWVQDCKV